LQIRIHCWRIWIQHLTWIIMRIRIQQLSLSGSFTKPDPLLIKKRRKFWHRFFLLYACTRFGIRIPNADPDIATLWMRTQNASGSATLQCSYNFDFCSRIFLKFFWRIRDDWLPDGLPVEFDHVHDLDGVVRILLAQELHESITLTIREIFTLRAKKTKSSWTILTKILQRTGIHNSSVSIIRSIWKKWHADHTHQNK